MRYQAKDKDYIKASRLRMDFFNKYVVNSNTSLYKTVVERDWAYIAKREYNYMVNIKGAAWGFFIANIVWTQRIYANKRMVVWPLLMVFPLATVYFRNHFHFKHNKRLFDMCNVGEEYDLGKARNEVLRACNLILNVEDF